LPTVPGGSQTFFLPSAPASPAGALGCPGGGGTAVRDAPGLTRALAAVRPGGTILLADGEYRGNFTATTRADAARPITLCGSRAAVLTAAGGYVLHLAGASHWRLTGFSVRGGQKGVVTDRAVGNVLDGLFVEGTGQEAVHLRSASTDNVIRRSTIRRTGLADPRFGEGVYVGSAVNNWPRYSGGGPDRSDRNLVEGNSVTDTTAECVDVKEGTTGGVVRGNRLSGRGLVPGAADSVIDVKGNGWTVRDNVATDLRGDPVKVRRVAGWGVSNRVEGNRVEGAPGI
jgi:hypothetical protein